MYDSDYCGRADDGPMPVLCKCKNVAMKHVAFEGCWTGRRFYACSGEVSDDADPMFVMIADPMFRAGDLHLFVVCCVICILGW